MLGGVAPDASLYIMAGFSLFVLGIDAEIVFGQLYFSPSWHYIFAIDNSFFVWGAGALICWRFGWRNGLVFALAGLLHIALDFPLHHDDGRAHFWPLSDWVFQSPISYWDSDHYGGIVSGAEAILVLILTLVLWRRFAPAPNATFLKRHLRLIFILLAVMQLAPAIIFGLMF